MKFKANPPRARIKVANLYYNYQICGGVRKCEALRKASRTWLEWAGS